MQIDIRNFQLKDYEEVAELVQGLTTAASWTCHLPNNDYHCIVAVAQESLGQNGCEFIKRGEVVGFASIFLLRKIFWSQPVGQIEDVIVNTYARGNSIGKYLVSELIMRAKKLNCYKVILDCDEKVLPFYEKLGFYHNGCCARLDFTP